MTTRDRGRPWPTLRVPALLLTAVLLLTSWSHGRAAAAGTGEGREPGDDPQAQAAWDSVVVSAPSSRTPRHFVGKLPKPLSWYATRGAEFHVFVRGKGWNGHARLRKCEGCPDGKKAKMLAQAITNLHRDPLTPLPENGVVVGRVMNIGSYTDATTQIPAQAGPHRDQYYFVITDRRSRDSAAMWIVRLQFDSLGRARDSLTFVQARYDFMKCTGRHFEPRRRRSEGDFRDCPGVKRATPAPPRSRGDATQSPSLFHLASFLPLHREPPVEELAYAWFSCDGGCCSAKWPP